VACADLPRSTVQSAETFRALNRRGAT
jgi:hypothetical protein